MLHAMWEAGERERGGEGEAVCMVWLCWAEIALADLLNSFLNGCLIMLHNATKVINYF